MTVCRGDSRGELPSEKSSEPMSLTESREEKPSPSKPFQQSCMPLASENMSAGSWPISMEASSSVSMQSGDSGVVGILASGGPLNSQSDSSGSKPGWYMAYMASQHGLNASPGWLGGASDRKRNCPCDCSVAFLAPSAVDGAPAVGIVAGAAAVTSVTALASLGPGLPSGPSRVEVTIGSPWSIAAATTAATADATPAVDLA
mmetsp:Transcript_39841/g.104633  ORF Transcript_39841/g.104633 Transcript_39841/m.104633 type:complete len:202 (-) Transcript_39841:676-1281(-)